MRPIRVIRLGASHIGSQLSVMSARWRGSQGALQRARRLVGGAATAVAAQNLQFQNGWCSLSSTVYPLGL